MKPLFVLAGAGAGADISTRKLTNALLDYDGLVFPYISPRYRPALESGLGEMPIQQIPFFRWLLRACESVYPTAAKSSFGFRPAIGEPNFEELIHIVERLSYLFHESYYDSVYQRPPTFERPFYDVTALGILLSTYKPMNFYDIIIRSCNIILDTVASLAVAYPATSSEILVSALRAEYQLRLFSLNYDSRIAGSHDWWTSFRPSTAADLYGASDTLQRFDPQPEIPNGQHAFIQMHGSTHFRYIEDYIAPRYVIARSRHQLLKHKTPRREGFEMWSDRSTMPILPMITGFRKGEKVLIEPYASYFRYFQNEAFRSPRWLLLGYGGGDVHVNAALRHAADFWGDRLRVYVCTKLTATWPDGTEFMTQMKQRIRFLGRAGYAWKAHSPPDVDGVFRHHPSVRVSIDGTFENRLADITHFFDA